jgi:hypothetical protein
VFNDWITFIFELKPLEKRAAIGCFVGTTFLIFLLAMAVVCGFFNPYPNSMLGLLGDLMIFVFGSSNRSSFET